MTKLQKYFYRIVPSSKLKKDMNISYNSCGNLSIISLEGLSMTKPTKQKILKLRNKTKSITLYREQYPLTLIIPYRNRQEHLKKFIPTIEKILQNQQIDYEIIIVEQNDILPFNRAKLMNIGVLNSRKESNYFIFHDVDMIPFEVDYRYCNQTVRPLNYTKEEAEEKFEERPRTFFGGITLVPKNIFFDINGFSNNYWHWGKEDDDFLYRHLYKGYIPFYDKKAKITLLPHPLALHTDNNNKNIADDTIKKQNFNFLKENQKRFSLFKRGITNQMHDGINNVIDYDIISNNLSGNIRTIKINFLAD